MKDKDIRDKIVILSGASGDIGNILMSALDESGAVVICSGRLALLGERFTKLLPAAFPLLDLIGGARMRIYRQGFFPEGIKTGK
jgi:hypothetical protein